MGMSWILWVTCMLCWVAVIFGESKQDKPEELDAEALKKVDEVFSALLGFKPCLDDSCLGSQASVSVSGAVGQSSGDYKIYPEIEKIYPKIEKIYPEQKLCAETNPEAITIFRYIESQHPGFYEVRSRILEELINYAFRYSAFYAENCSVEMQVLDLIILAANKLREEYLQLPGGHCTYYFEEGSEWPEPSISCVPDETVSTSPSPVYKKKPVATPKPQLPTSPCTEDSSTVSTTLAPCTEQTTEEIEEVIAEDDYAPMVGSIRGIPGVHYPNYTDVPITSFSCADKHIPGFYADLETGCQVFHVCYEHRRESFLCPIGTIFNQPILACDYWYSSNCSLAPAYFEINVKSEVSEEEEIHAVKDMISVIIQETDDGQPEETLLEDIAKFLPVKATISEYPGAPKVTEVTKKPAVQDVDDVAAAIFDKMVIAATAVTSKTKDIIETLPPPSGSEYKPVSKVVPLAKTAAKLAAVKASVPIFAKAKLAAATLPLAAAKAAAIPIAKVAATKAAIPVLAKAKLAAVPAAKVAAKVVATKVAVPVAKVTAAKVAVPVAKVVAAKVAVPAVKVAAAKIAVPAVKVAAAKIAVPAAKVIAAPIVAKGKLAAAAGPVAVKVAAKASIPALKAKMIASALPLAKAKLAVPAIKAKALAAGGIPLVKAKVLAAPLVTAKLAKAAAISPLTKKALALGYMKLIKAKKLALMG